MARGRIRLPAQRPEPARRCAAFIQPVEDGRQFLPKLVKRRADGQLVGKHLVPLYLDGGPLRAVGQRCIGRNRDALELAFACQRAADDGTVRLQISAAVEMHDVVQVARSLALCQGAHLLGEDFLERIAQDVYAVCRHVGIGVVNGPLDLCLYIRV